MIIQNIEFLILVPVLLYPILIAYRKEGYGRKNSVNRTMIALILILAAASPAITQTVEAQTEQKLNILWDNTTSMKAVENPEIQVSGTEKTFISGNNSKIFTQASQNIEPQSENLLITDGQTEETSEQLINKANRLDTSISIYHVKDKEESSVWIEGPSTTVPGANNEFTVKTSSTKETAQPVTVRLDGKGIFSGRINESYSFERKFDSEGQHTLKASLNSTDIFQSNNKYFKTVSVREKPEILVIGENGGLKDSLEQFYTVETSQTVPEDLSQYYTVILKKPLESSKIKSYLSEGNGLMYTGTLNQSIPDYLPVKKSESSEEDSGAKVVIVIDASEGTGGECIEGTEDFCIERSTTGGSAKESIEIAYGLVDSLNENNRVGVTAYNRDSYLVSETQSLAYNRDSIKKSISRITPEGPSFHDKGLEGGNQLVDSNDTVVMLTDGKIGDYERNRNVPFKLRTQANSMDAKLITVGMGENPNQLLLEGIAENTGGYYLENDEAGRLKFNFGAGGGETEYTPIAVTDPTHFITEGLELEGSTTGFDEVDVKKAGRSLVSGSNAKEALSTWRYGLGRVAAFSADDENLGRIKVSDPDLVSKTVSWTVGNPQRKKKDWKNVEDAERPEKPVAEASYQLQGLTQESDNLYTADLMPRSLGFHEWQGEMYAYNYNTEKKRLGQDMDKLSAVAQETGGKIYSSENIGKLSEDLDEISRQVKEKISLSPYLVSLALILFLAEVGYRKRKGRL